MNQNKICARLLFAGNLIRQPYMIGANYRISGDLTNTDNVANNTFWMAFSRHSRRECWNLQRARIEAYLGVNF